MLGNIINIEIEKNGNLKKHTENTFNKTNLTFLAANEEVEKRHDMPRPTMTSDIHRCLSETQCKM